MTPEVAAVWIVASWLGLGLIGGYFVMLTHALEWRRMFGMERPLNLIDYVCMTFMSVTGPIGGIMGFAIYIQVRREDRT